MLSADVVPPTARCLVMQLRTRTHWITALMYIQLTKVGLCDADIQEANRLTLVHIDNAVTLLSNAPLRSRQSGVMFHFFQGFRIHALY